MKNIGLDFQGVAFGVAKLFRQISNLLQDVFTNSGYKFTNEQLWVLMLLWEKEGVSQQSIGNRLVRDKATISHLINVLERKTVVYRVLDPKDERQKMIFLTEKGVKMKGEVQPRLVTAFKDVFLEVDNLQLKDFAKVLNSMILGF